ncbi:hypothetical protein [Streptomyces sp. MMBL 11-3]|uniref:hypothetical protein n=1 Tax=Streptomyces sp. MMBL 11-3 TaxID=3382639 RepID=UPI0039B6C11E
MSPVRLLRTAVVVALLASAVFTGVLTPQAVAAQSTQTAQTTQSVQSFRTVRAAPPSLLPLPLPVAGVEPIVSEGVTVEGPLINNITLPMLR